MTDLLLRGLDYWNDDKKRRQQRDQRGIMAAHGKGLGSSRTTSASATHTSNSMAAILNGHCI